MSSKSVAAFRALGVLCLGPFFAVAQPQVPPSITTRQAGKLELHHPVEREIGPGQADVFAVDAVAGQFLRVVAEQKGVDVVVRIVAPDGRVLVTADRSNGNSGPESASVLAPLPGSIQIRVEENPHGAETGRYALELTDLHFPTDQDRRRIEAETKLFLADTERRAGDSASRRKALADYSAAAALFLELQDDYERGLCLFGSGVASDRLGENRNAVDYYYQAFESQRKAGDYSGGASTLETMSDLISESGDRQQTLDLLNQALAIKPPSGDGLPAAMLFEFIASLYNSAGENDKALEFYSQALRYYRSLGNRAGEGSTLKSVGQLYQTLGERQKALDSYVQALAFERAGDSGAHLTTLSHLGELSRSPKDQSMVPKQVATGSTPDDLPVHLVAQVGHPYGAVAIAFSADGHFLLTANGGERSASLWSVSDGKEIRTFEGHTDTVTCVAFLPGGTEVVTGSWDQTLRIWDLHTGREIQRMQDTITIGALSVSPSGDLIATASNGFFMTSAGTGSYKAAHLWNRRTGTNIRSFEGHTDSIRAVAFSPDGKWLATGSADRTARLWEVATGKEIRRFTGHASIVNSVAFSPDGRMLATASGLSMLLDVMIDSQTIRNLSASEQEKRAFEEAIAAEHTIRLWNLNSGDEIRKIDAPAAVSAVAFSSDGRYLASGGGYTSESRCTGCETHLWDVVSGKAIGQVLETAPGPTPPTPVQGLAFSPDARLLARSVSTDVIVSQTASGREVGHLMGYALTGSSLAIAPDGRHTVIGITHAAPLWDHQTGRPQPIFSGPPVARVMDFSPDSTTLAGSVAAPTGADSQIGFWDLRTQTEARHFSRSGKIEALRFSPDGRLLLVQAPDQPPCVIEAGTGAEVRCFRALAGAVFAAFFSPAGDSVIAVSLTIPTNDLSPRAVMVWDIKTGAELRSFKVPGETSWVTAAVSPVGETVVLSGYSSRLYNWRTGGLERELFTSIGMAAGPVSFSPDGRWLAVTSSADTSIWDVSSGQEKWEFSSRGFPSDVKFSPDGHFLFRSGANGLTYVWELATGKEVCALVSFTDGSWAVTDPDGRYDASNPDEAIGLHWVAGTEVIELGQLKQRFYTPGLFARVLRGEQLPDVASIQTIKLFPTLEIQQPAPGSTRLNVKLTNRGGGIGRVVVKVNGKEIASDARGAGINPETPTAQLAVDLAGAVHAADGRNTVEVFAYDGRNLLSSRGFKVDWKTDVTASAKLPRLFALVAGVSEYDNPDLNLRYAAKDAESMAQALQRAGEGLLGKGQVSVHLLSTSGIPGSAPPTKKAFLDAFSSIISEAEDQDILVVYLAGHGVALRGMDDEYYFLTRAARSTELPVNDLTMMDLATVSSEDLRKWCYRTKARKEVIILDTCAAGAAREELNKLGNRRDLSADQTRAIEMLKDRIGAHILMGSASNAVSYETTSYGQGLLTYALLQGMKGAALEEGSRVDVVKLFNFASNRVVELARGIGGIQQPQISSPGGQSFLIGLLSDADKLAIPLAKAKPQLMQVHCYDEQDGDSLGLSQRVRTRLKDASQLVTRGNQGAEQPVVYSDEDLDIPSAMSPVVRYQVQGGKVEARVILRRDSKVVSNETVTAGTDPEAAAQQIADTIIRAASRAGGQ